jgi:hypothetical protein
MVTALGRSQLSLSIFLKDRRKYTSRSRIFPQEFLHGQECSRILVLLQENQFLIPIDWWGSSSPPWTSFHSVFQLHDLGQVFHHMLCFPQLEKRKGDSWPKLVIGQMTQCLWNCFRKYVLSFINIIIKLTYSALANACIKFKLSERSTN